MIFLNLKSAHHVGHRPDGARGDGIERESYCAGLESAYNRQKLHQYGIMIHSKSTQGMDTEAIVLEAMELHKEGEFDKAADKYKEAIDLNSRDKRVFTNYAAILRHQR